jgi:hypothetical protein
VEAGGGPTAGSCVCCRNSLVGISHPAGRGEAWWDRTHRTHGPTRAACRGVQYATRKGVRCKYSTLIQIVSLTMVLS